MTVELYDTTLRDGAQMEGISLSVEDKLRIARKLDELGVHYIEGGFPAANPKDIEFFDRVRDVRLNAKLVAFGSTRRAGIDPAKDATLNVLVKAGTDYVTIVGKAHDLHVREVLSTTLDENLAMIGDSVRYLKANRKLSSSTPSTSSTASSPTTNTPSPACELPSTTVSTASSSATRTAVR
jgi:2-isopropylmalate synthase